MGSIVLKIWLRSEKASSRNLEESCSLQTAPQQPVAVASESYSEFLWDTSEPSTPLVQYPASGPLLTPGAAKITEEASYGTTEDMGAVVDELQAWVEEQLHWLKGNTSSLKTLSES